MLNREYRTSELHQGVTGLLQQSNVLQQRTLDGINNLRETLEGHQLQNVQNHRQFTAQIVAALLNLSVLSAASTDNSTEGNHQG
jgi:hypothetical protein